jgi:hypothetical protein
MKSSLCIVVMACLIASPLAACAARRGPRHIDAASGGAESGNWSRVTQLAPGAEVSLTLADALPGTRYFVMADEAVLVALNLTGAALPTAAVRVLRDMAAMRPNYLVAAQKSGAFRQANVQVGPDGVFVADRKVADLNRVVETVARADVRELRGPVVARGSVAGALLGGWLGFAVGAVPALGGAPEGLAWLLVMSSTAFGGYLGFRWSDHETEGIVYRAP